MRYFEKEFKQEYKKRFKKDIDTYKLLDGLNHIFYLIDQSFLDLDYSLNMKNDLKESEEIYFKLDLLIHTLIRFDQRYYFECLNKLGKYRKIIFNID